MALFSRRKKTSSAPPAQGIEPGEQPVEPVPPAAADAAADATATASRADVPASDASPADSAAPAAPEAAPEVSISVSAFRGVGSGTPVTPAASAAPADIPEGSIPVRPQVPAEAPPPRETIPGLRDNVLLVDALRALSSPATGPELLNVARQLLQGHVFLRVQGDARALLAQGAPLPMSVAGVGDKRFVLAYSGGAALQDGVRADGATDTSAMGQPVLAVLRHVLSSEFDGIILDNSSAPARAVLPRAILQRAIDDADENLRIKTLLSAERTDATASEVAMALTQAPLWIAVKRTGEGGAVGVAENRTVAGERWLEVFSHPLESVVLARGDATAPITAVQLATALARDTGLSGLLVNPAGPWIRVSRDDLAPLLTLAP